MEKPVFNNGLAPTGPAQMAEVADFAEQGWWYRSGTTAERVALPSDEKITGLHWEDTDDGNQAYIWNGSAWVIQFPAISWTPVWTTSGTAPALGNSILTGKYTRVGKRVRAIIYFQTGNTGVSGGTGTWRFSLPLTPSSSDMGVVTGTMLSATIARYAASAEVPPSTAYVTNIWMGGVSIESGSLAAGSVLRLIAEYDIT